MPHDKAHIVGGLALDRRRALTITDVGLLDSCGRSGDPFKIQKRRVSEDDHAVADVAKCAKKCPRIHWSQLASNGASCQPKQHHNGGQTVAYCYSDLSLLDINRMQACSQRQHNIKKKKKQQSAKNMGNEEGNYDHEEVAAVQRNGEVIDEEGRARESVLRLSLGAVGDQIEKGLTEVPPAGCKLLSSDVECRKMSKVHASEPIILSSEEEEEDENNSTSHIQTLDGAKDPHRPNRLALNVERKKTPDSHNQASERHSQKLMLQIAMKVMKASSFVDPSLSCSPEMELQFSALYMGGLSVLSSGLLKITHDKITISLKDSSGAEVKASLATAHLRKYSIWEGLLVQDSELAKQNKTPPPSLLLLWLSEAQARRLFIDLSVIQPGLCPAEGSVCVVLCVSEPLKGIEGTLLASIMDIVGLRHGTTELLSPVTHSESIKLLQSGRDTHLLQLLQPKPATHASLHEAASAPVPEATAAAPLMDPDVQANSVYTLCHNRAQSSHSVSMATRPGPEWTPYRHHGPACRLIQFPPPPCKGAITVTTEDLECLDSGEFLNDVIIDFYLKYLLVQKAPRSSVKRSHVFSSFFYKQLTRRDNANEDSTSTPAQLRRHQRVRTWTRHVDIFEKDFLFVPVNQEAHWYLVVVCFPGMDEPQWMEREAQDAVQEGIEISSDSVAGSETQEGSRHNSDGDKSSDENSSRPIFTPGPPNCTERTCKRKTVCKRPCILIMDSLKLSVHERIFKLLREYLQVEWEVKRGGQRDFSAERMVGSHCRVPLQDNSSDCGLYLLQYAESFLQDPMVHFDLPLRLECWFPRQQVREKREEIRDLVLHLYRFQHGSLGNEGWEDKTEIGNAV
ncbi:hypothetical protein NFI96_026422 [Prochilodus magdalenae]|nr:hypothetical protein NFI96_026422 [Prochilodus magdalenae]